MNTTFNDFKTLTLLKKLDFGAVLFIFPKKRIILSECSGEIMNKYLVILVCVMCAVSTGWAKKKKSHKAVQEPEAVEQVEESAAEEPAEEPAAVEASDETAAVEAPAVETPAEESAEETAAEETTVAEASETEEVAAEDESSEEVASDDEEEDQPKKKKKKKSKKKKSKKKKKKKHSDDDEDEYMGGPKMGVHMVLSPEFTNWNRYGASWNLGFAFAYYFNSHMAVRTGLDLGLSYIMGKDQYSTGYYSYEYNYTSLMISLQLPVYFRYAINDMFWAEAGVVAGGNVYSYSHTSSDYGSSSSYGQIGKGNFDSNAGLYNTTLGGGVSLGNFEVGLQVGVSNWSTFACNVGLTLGLFF